MPTLTRRTFVGLATAALLPAAAPEALAEPHFPSRLHLFVWRNWELAPAVRLAGLLGTTVRHILDLGRSMGLPAKRNPTPADLRRSYITLIRQNWHILPESQITDLLGWTPDKLAFTLKEDDFLEHKLGPKPECEPLRWHNPTRDERTAAAHIRSIVRDTMSSELLEPGEPAFSFVRQLSTPGAAAPTRSAWNPTYIYSYFALYGDPLTEPDLDPFPSGYLQQLANRGITGVWMQAILNQLAPSTQFPDFGRGAEVRLDNLRKLVARAQKVGIMIYLYLNEPRSMPATFFERHPNARGRSSAPGFAAMCTSAPEVRDWIRSALTHIVRQVPDLGGLFTITMSENQTNCFSHGGAWGTGAPNAGDCPRCSRRTSWDTIGELIQTFRDGIRDASPTAELITWDWGWGDTLARNLIPLLPRDTAFMSISEWEQPVDRGGVHTRVGEYSISVPGPGPRATRNWKLAKDRGLKILAKVQLNNTWEISAVPYIPVLDLVAEHCRNLSSAGIDGLMASWTCGGYPSPNLQVAQGRPLEELAPNRHVREGWRLFSEAFREFPYGVAIYTIPTQHGPANLLRHRPTGVRASMILFPQDDLKSWCGAYPPEVVEQQFRRLADGWQRGLEHFRTGAAEADLAIAETCGNHFRSVANQVEFCILRTRNDAASRKRLREIAADEIDIARAQYRWARRNSTIAYEASNHYYYRPLDLVEKILNCRWLLDGPLKA